MAVQLSHINLYIYTLRSSRAALSVLEYMFIDQKIAEHGQMASESSKKWQSVSDESVFVFE
jgi:hypothetical protein